MHGESAGVCQSAWSEEHTARELERGPTRKACIAYDPTIEHEGEKLSRFETEERVS